MKIPKCGQAFTGKEVNKRFAINIQRGISKSKKHQLVVLTTAYCINSNCNNPAHLRIVDNRNNPFKDEIKSNFLFYEGDGASATKN